MWKVPGFTERVSKKVNNGFNCVDLAVSGAIVRSREKPYEVETNLFDTYADNFGLVGSS